MITRYGVDNFLVMLAVSILLMAAGVLLTKGWGMYALLIVGLVLAVFTFWFFRDPERTIPESAVKDESIILSPADGKVVEIKEITENKYLNSQAIQVSIFLSPLDVHVNRSPVTGKVEFYKYVPGDYLVAYHPKSSELNEHSLIGVNTRYGKVLFKQIVGILARRLVCELKEGDIIKSGQKFGMMKFGSRMDVIVDKSTNISIKTGDKVIGGITVLGSLNINKSGGAK